ncbi:MAG: hypothetical protein IJD09_00140 [Clostridia bacterium]|nr:hypothetical protein [Clostridia bacterium]
MGKRDWEEEALSNEDLDEMLDEQEVNPKPRFTIKYVRYLLLMIMAMVAILFLIGNRDLINGDNFRRLMTKINVGFSAPAAENGTVYLDVTGGGETVVYKDGFASATVEKLLITDKNGTEFQNTPLGFREPRLVANDKYVMAYDCGGTGVLIADSFSVLFETTMSDNIVTAKMTPSGAFVVVTEGDGYLSKVFVFDSSFHEVYRYNSLSRYILDADLSDDGKSMAVSAMNIEGADIVAEILYFKLNKEEVQWTVSYDQNPCIHLDIKNNDSICGLFSWGMVSLNAKGTEQGQYKLDNQVLQCFNVDDADKTVFAVSAAESGNTTLVVCNEKGVVKDTVDLDYYAVRIDYCDGRIAALGSRKCSIYNTNGKLLWEGTPERATGVAFMGKNAVVLIGETKCVYSAI